MTSRCDSKVVQTMHIIEEISRMFVLGGPGIHTMSKVVLLLPSSPPRQLESSSLS